MTHFEKFRKYMEDLNTLAKHPKYKQRLVGNWVWTEVITNENVERFVNHVNRQATLYGRGDRNHAKFTQNFLTEMKIISERIYQGIVGILNINNAYDDELRHHEIFRILNILFPDNNDKVFITIFRQVVNMLKFIKAREDTDNVLDQHVFHLLLLVRNDNVTTLFSNKFNEELRQIQERENFMNRFEQLSGQRIRNDDIQEYIPDWQNDMRARILDVGHAMGIPHAEIDRGIDELIQERVEQNNNGSVGGGSVAARTSDGAESAADRMSIGIISPPNSSSILNSGGSHRMASESSVHLGDPVHPNMPVLDLAAAAVDPQQDVLINGVQQDQPILGGERLGPLTRNAGNHVAGTLVDNNPIIHNGGIHGAGRRQLGQRRILINQMKQRILKRQ